MAKIRAPFSAVLLIAAGCAIDSAPTSLRDTPAGNGPTVVFDLSHQPLPNIPVPNDVATFADPSSRTGLRLNVSMLAPTHLEESARAGFAEMEGWGTFAPITVQFNHGANDDPHGAALDLADIQARMQHDGHDTSNDPVYVVNLKTGIPVLVDMGDGDFPLTEGEQDLYYPNDPHLGSNNFLYETNEEGLGLTQADYTPARDVDFDGVLDHPNTLGTSGKAGIDNVMSWYERQTDTLILQPVLPMDEKTEYAVVLTDRLHGSGGSPVKSPFPAIYHPTQRDEASQVEAILSDASRTNYYGDIAGTGLNHVAFVWSFTTQPVYEDLKMMRDGLYGSGKLAALNSLYPATATAYPAVGLAPDASDEPANYQSDPRCAPHLGTPYILHPADAMDAISQLIQQLFPQSDAANKAFLSTFDDIDYVVTGSYKTPYFLGDPDHEDPDARFQIDFKNGVINNAGSDTGHFFMTIPKKKAGFAEPFPVVLWAHGTGQSDAEIIARAGYFAKQGLAMFGIDMPGHGLVISPGQLSLAEGFFQSTCLVPWVAGLAKGRARDLDGDGVPDSGGLLFTSHIFHTRDNLRETVVDLMHASRILRAFDQPGTQDTNNDGKPDLMGDFNGDGIPDIGGAKGLIYAAGDSYGGIASQVFGALDPNITAVTPISGSGGVTTLANRSLGVVDWVDEQIITPLVVAVPASSRPAGNDGPHTRCTGDQMSVRFVVNNLQASNEIEIACLSTSELPPNATVLLANLNNNEVKCARTDKNGAFRVPVPADAGDSLAIQIYDAPDVVDSYKTCNVTAGAPAGRAINTWEQALTIGTPTGDSTASCTADNGCQQYRDTFFPVGSQLVAPQAGLGLFRNSPEARQLLNLTQAAVDVGDPVNFAPYYMMRPMPNIDGTPMGPRPILTSYTVGDEFVNIATGYSFARAVGALPFLPPGAATSMPDYAPYATPAALYASLGSTTPDQALVDHSQIEGVARLAREPAGPTCSANYQGGTGCEADPGMSASECSTTLFDADWFAEGADKYDQQHLAVPLRLARLASEPSLDVTSLEKSWAPRMQGAPFTADANAYVYNASNPPMIGLVSAYVNPQGQHVWLIGDPCKAWDDAVYYDQLITRFMMTNGRDVYFLSHPSSHRCLSTSSCDFFPPSQ